MGAKKPVKKRAEPAQEETGAAPGSQSPSGSSNEPERSPATSAAPGAAAERPEAPGPPVVGIGASAGGLDAFKKLFIGMPPASGIALVLIPHLDPTHESLMVELLARHTSM